VPFSGFEDFGECVRTMTDEEGHDEESAKDICGALQAEAKSENGDPEGLLDAIQRGSGLVADVGVDLVSGVDVPAVNSKWVMLKDGGGRRGRDYRVNTPILVKDTDSEDKRLSYAAAMIPREPDKEGDVVPTATVETAAHGFLKDDGGIDTDHSLIDGDGEPVESWVLKEERTFDLPGGGSETYPAGTWMLGVEWGAEAWQRIKDGELTGLSIYGMAEHVPLARAASCQCQTAKSGDSGKSKDADTESMGETTPDDGDGAGGADGGGGDGDGPTLAELSASVEDLADTVSAVKDAVETEPTDKQGAEEAAEMLAEEYDSMGMGDVMDLLAVADAVGPDDALEAIESAEEAEEMAEEMDDEEEDEEEKADDGQETEKADEKADFSKGYDGEGTREAATEKRADDGGASGGMPSYADAAKQRERGEN